MDSNIIIAIFLVILAFVILYMMSDNKKKAKKNRNTSSTTQLKSSISLNEMKSFESENLDTLRFPHLIESMEHNQLANACEVIYDTFRFLDYSKKSNDELMEKEWHSWQVAILLKYLSKKAVYIKPNVLEMIPTRIRDLSKDALDLELKLLVRKYIHSVDIHESREKLSEQIEWTPRDISIILMCILNEEEK